jgi:hypothetical protein
MHASLSLRIYRLFPSVLRAISVIEPETVIRWHRKGFRLYWRWKSRSRGGRPRMPGEIRRLIRDRAWRTGFGVRRASTASC